MTSTTPYGEMAAWRASLTGWAVALLTLAVVLIRCLVQNDDYRTRS